MNQLYARKIKAEFEQALLRHKSVLLLGPRQVGKTTFLKSINWDINISLLLKKYRFKYENNPDILIQEIEAHPKFKKGLRVLIDEVQLVPELLNTSQYIIDNEMAQMVLTGSSARKLRKHININLLPGRLVLIRMDALSLTEHQKTDIESLLLFGELPGIISLPSTKEKNIDLESYVMTYLEEEIRKEAVTKNIPAFYRFLELAAIESGKIISFRQIGSQSEVTHNTISAYYEILEDSLIINRIDPYTLNTTRKKITKSSKYLFFDLGVRRVAAREGVKLGRTRMGELFEHYVGNELIRLLNFHHFRNSLSFWRDADGPEVDWLIQTPQLLIPIEVKYKSKIEKSDCKHLELFLTEYAGYAKQAFVVCLCDLPYKINDRITAIPWQRLELVLKDLLTQ